MSNKITNFEEFEKNIAENKKIELNGWKEKQKNKSETQKSFTSFIFYILKASKYQEYIDFILENVDLNMQEPNLGWTLLHLAAGNNEPNIVKLLIDNGADPNIESHKGKKPLDSANDKKIIKEKGGAKENDPLLIKINKIIEILKFYHINVKEINNLDIYSTPKKVERLTPPNMH